jgi:hypothetical protein
MMIKPTIKMSQIMIRFSFSIVGSYRCLGVQKHLLIQPPCGVESKKESLQVAYRVIIGAEVNGNGNCLVISSEASVPFMISTMCGASTFRGIAPNSSSRIPA